MTPFPLEYIVRVAICVLLIAFGNGNGGVYAQTSNFFFEHLTSEHGLSSNKVEAVLQDSVGFYWIATQNGLNRYDGTSFKVYRHHSTDSLSLTHNHCTALAAGPGGDIMVATYYGLSRFDKSKGNFQQIYLPHPSRNREIANRIANICTDKDGNVWMSGHGFWKYDLNQDSVFYVPLPKTGQSKSDQGLVAHIEYDSIHHGIWLSSSYNLYFYDILTQQFYYDEFNPKQWNVFAHADDTELAIDNKNRLWFLDRNTQLGYFDLVNNIVGYTGRTASSGLRSIHTDNKNRVWLCYWIVRTEIYDPESRSLDSSFFVIHHPRSIINEITRSIYIDAQQNYWISSADGISIYNEGDQYYKMYRINLGGSGVINNQLKITAIAQTEPGEMWIGANNGLYKYKLKEGNLMPVNIGISPVYIFSLLADDNKLWIDTDFNVIALDLGTEKVVEDIHIGQRAFLRKGSTDDIWIGCWNRGLYHYQLKTKKLEKLEDSGLGPNSLLPAGLISGYLDQNALWIGYNGGAGFSRYEIDKNTFTHFHPLQHDSTHVVSRTITEITRGNDSTMWLGTYGNGVVLFNTKVESYKHIRQEHGLNSNFVNSILRDEDANIWISTADGLNYYNSRQGTLNQVDPELVFTDNEFVANAIHGLDGKLYFFCKNEIVEITPDAYHPEQNAPRIVISGFSIFDEEYPGFSNNAPIKLSYRENFFSFEYSLIRTHPLREVTYAYILRGFDNDWNIGTKNYASYTNVPAGNYEFMVKATNHDGQWTNVLVNIPIHITPPFWRTWWFIVLCSIAVIGGILALYLYRIGQIRRVYSIKAKISQDLHDDVGSSLSSIHIYSTVAERALDSSPEKVREVVQQIKQNSRQVMESMGDIVWSIQTEGYGKGSLANRVRNYSTDLLSQKNIECTYHIDPRVDRKLQQPESRKNILLIIKEALNNIAKYSEASQAEVTVATDRSDILITIADNGKGFDPDLVSRGNGLNNMEQRTRSLGGSFHIRSSPGGGTSIQSRIPISRIRKT